MKFLLYCFVLILIPGFVIAQTPTDSIPVITINCKLIGKDSVIIPFDKHYSIVQDNCAEIIRYGHYDFKNKTFVGRFRDVKKYDTTQIVAEGSYANGLKEGLFVLHYLDGKLMAKGTFKHDKYDGDWTIYYPNGSLSGKGSFKDNKFVGKWELYYDNGKPKLFFDVEKSVCKILNAWSPDDVKIVNEGDGTYQTESSAHWAGRLSNGLPDSTWIYYKGANDKDGTVLEYFKQNKFVRGHTDAVVVDQDYTNASHISLLPQLPRIEIDVAQYLSISPACNGIEYSKVYIKMFNKIYLEKKILLPGAKGLRN